VDQQAHERRQHDDDNGADRAEAEVHPEAGIDIEIVVAVLDDVVVDPAIDETLQKHDENARNRVDAEVVLSQDACGENSE
jgi:hypothetical protein